MFCQKIKCSQKLLEGDGIESRLPFKIFSTLQNVVTEGSKSNIRAGKKVLDYYSRLQSCFFHEVEVAG